MTTKTKQRIGAVMFIAGFLAIQAYIVSKNGWLWTLGTLAVAVALAGGYHLMGDRKS